MIACDSHLTIHHPSLPRRDQRSYSKRVREGGRGAHTLHVPAVRVPVRAPPLDGPDFVFRCFSCCMSSALRTQAAPWCFSLAACREHVWSVYGVCRLPSRLTNAEIRPWLLFFSLSRRRPKGLPRVVFHPKRRSRRRGLCFCRFSS